MPIGISIRRPCKNVERAHSLEESRESKQSKFDRVWAAYDGYNDIFKILLHAEAEPNYTDAFGYYPL